MKQKRWRPNTGGNALTASLIKQSILIYVVAVPINYAWERLRSPLYARPDGSGIPAWDCFVASVVDGLFVLLIFTAGWAVLRRRDWFEHPSELHYRHEHG